MLLLVHWAALPGAFLPPVLISVRFLRSQVPALCADSQESQEKQSPARPASKVPGRARRLLFGRLAASGCDASGAIWADLY